MLLHELLSTDPKVPAYLLGPLQEEYGEYLRHWPTIVEAQHRESFSGSADIAPHFAIVTPIYYTDLTFLRATIDSVLQQTYPHWELLLVLDGPQGPSIEWATNNAATIDPRITVIRLPTHSGISAATNAGVRAARGEYIGLLDHDDVLEPTALALVAAAIASSLYPPDLLYTDHDKIDVEGRRYDPELKPDWSPETLLSSCYIGHFKVFRRECFLALGGFRPEYDGVQDYDLLLRFAEHPTTTHHIPHILYHWRSAPTSTAASASAKPASIERGMRALQEALNRRKKRVRVFRPPFAHQSNIGVYSLQFQSRDFAEHVTIIIPTKDRPDLLEPCIRSIRDQTTYPRYEILVVNNGTVEQRLTRFIEKEGARRLDIHTEEFNFSSLLNRAVEHVQTPLVLFLNDDTEVLSGDWLLQMLGVITLDDHIGAVGAKLLSPNGRTQHAGIVLGLWDCTAGHANRGLPGDDAGYRNSNRVLRNFAAVTAACMLTRTDLFRELGGLDEKHLPVAYNDVDYCLKILAKGYRIAQVPEALLLHRQAASRGLTFDPDLERASRTHLRRAWAPILHSDPYTNPHLSREHEILRIRSYPRGRRILLVSHNLEYEGASLSLLELAMALKSRDYHIEVSASKPGPLADIYAERNIPMQIGKEGDPHPLLRINRDAFDILFLNTIGTYELLHNADVCAHPTIWCIRESERAHYIQALPSLSPQVFSAASRVLFVADATRCVYRDLDRGHFRTIHTGIDIAEIDAASEQIDRTAVRRALGIADADTVITTMGTICPRKGQKGFVDAAIALLHHSSLHHLHFLIVGGGTLSSYEEELSTYIRESGFCDHIYLIEKTSDVDHFYAASDIFVCNSSIESFPRVILEAMAWKLPIIATNVFGIPEQVRDEEEALLIPPDNSGALVDAIRRLLDDQILRQKLAHNARSRVDQCFHIDHMVDQYETLFQELSTTSMRVSPPFEDTLPLCTGATGHFSFRFSSSPSRYSLDC